MNETIFDSVFWITISGLSVTFFIAIINNCLKSKCKKCNICYGCLVIERDIKSEVNEEEKEMENNINPYGIERIV